jgi:hypothetical protein
MTDKKIIYPKISILTPTYNRNEWLPLIEFNLKQFNYPDKRLLEWVIDDDGTEKMFENEEKIKEFEKKIYPIKINYHHYKKRRDIGEKRNNLVKLANYKHMANMDTDDHYLQNYLVHSIDVMKTQKKTLVGCNNMIFYFPKNDDKFTYFYSEGIQNINEATMVFTRDHWKRKKGFKKSQTSEGFKMAYDHLSGLTQIDNVMFCICHSDNTVDKKRFLENTNVDASIHPELKGLIYEILLK